jgi:hypothetical protein
MSRALKVLITIFALVFITSGAFMVLIVNADDNSAHWITVLARNHGIVFVWHLACWMTMGMFANYYWDIFNLGKGLESVQVERIVLPLLVSPIVFYPTYNLWLSSSSQSYILFEVIAFQSGFFWQALFTKARPLEQSLATNPWAVSYGATGNRNSGQAKSGAQPSTPHAGSGLGR